MEYKKFYLAIRRYAKGRITREEFLVEWKDAQRQQGMEPERLGLGGSKRTATA